MYETSARFVNRKKLTWNPPELDQYFNLGSKRISETAKNTKDGRLTETADSNSNLIAREICAAKILMYPVPAIAMACGGRRAQSSQFDIASA